MSLALIRWNNDFIHIIIPYFWLFYIIFFTGYSPLISFYTNVCFQGFLCIILPFLFFSLISFINFFIVLTCYTGLFRFVSFQWLISQQWWLQNIVCCLFQLIHSLPFTTCVSSVHYFWSSFTFSHLWFVQVLLCFTCVFTELHHFLVRYLVSVVPSPSFIVR